MLKNKKNLMLIIIIAVISVLVPIHFFYTVNSAFKVPREMANKIKSSIESGNLEEAFSYTGLKESRFITPKSFKNFIEEDEENRIRIVEDEKSPNGLKYDFENAVVDIRVKLPKGSTLMLDGIEIEETIENLEDTDIIFDVGEVFYGTHKIKITSPLAKDYDGTTEFFKDSDLVYGRNIIEIKDEYKKPIEDAAASAMQDIIASALKSEDFSSLKNNKKLCSGFYKQLEDDYNILLDMIKKGIIKKNSKINGIEKGTASIGENSNVSITLFADLGEMFPVNVKLVKEGESWTVFSFDFTDAPDEED